MNKYYIDTFFIKPKILKMVYESYLDGYTIEDIHWRLSLMKIEISDDDDINNIIDAINQINY